MAWKSNIKTHFLMLQEKQKYEPAGRNFFCSSKISQNQNTMKSALDTEWSTLKMPILFPRVVKWNTTSLRIHLTTDLWTQSGKDRFAFHRPLSQISTQICWFFILKKHLAQLTQDMMQTKCRICTSLLRKSILTRVKFPQLHFAGQLPSRGST